MTDQVHIAAQYLATAAISFLEKKEDDSHTNLGFNREKGYLETWPLNDKGPKIAFDYPQFALHWLADETTGPTLLLDGKTHGEVVKWMKEVTLALERNKPYTYKLHYELPYGPIKENFTFQKPSQSELRRLQELRSIAQGAMEKVVDSMNLDTTIRVWPHHFDTGSFAASGNDNSASIGFGMAIPDSIIDDFYLYTSGYIENNAVDTASFGPLSMGEWKNGDFKGAVLAMKNIDEAKAINFFEEAIQTYKK